MKHSKFFNSKSINSDIAWKKVIKAGDYKNWMDYQKWVLSQVKPIQEYKKGV